MRSEDIARIAHEVNRAYCQSIGDNSQVAWDDAPKWQRESAVQGVMAHLMSNGRMTPEASHEAWMKHKTEQGWTYGPTKDEVLKTHPCMVPYSNLPEAQRSKDYIFKAVIDSCGRYFANLTRKL